MKFNLLSVRDNCTKLGDISKSGYYQAVKEGVLPPPIKFGRSSKCDEHETDVVIAARVAGKSKTEIIALVKELIAARQGGAQ